MVSTVKEALASARAVHGVLGVALRHDGILGEKRGEGYLAVCPYKRNHYLQEDWDGTVMYYEPGAEVSRWETAPEGGALICQHRCSGAVEPWEFWFELSTEARAAARLQTGRHFPLPEAATSYCPERAADINKYVQSLRSLQAVNADESEFTKVFSQYKHYVLSRDMAWRISCGLGTDADIKQRFAPMLAELEAKF